MVDKSLKFEAIGGCWATKPYRKSPLILNVNPWPIFYQKLLSILIQIDGQSLKDRRQPEKLIIWNYNEKEDFYNSSFKLTSPSTAMINFNW